MSLDVIIPLQPKQVELLNLVEHSPATWIGYGGSRGGAKSHAARSIMLQRRLTNPNTKGCLLRRTYDLVRENHIDKLLAEFPWCRDYYRVVDKELHLPNGSVIAFRYAENRKDVDAMIGKEYMDFFVDQAEAFEERDLVTMKSCTRWPNTSYSACKFLLTFNPGNIGHAFLKRIFFDRRYQAHERQEDFAFLQAYGWDNWEWSRDWLQASNLTAEDYYAWDSDTRFNCYINNSQFGREQNALPPAMRVGWLLGKMDQFAGQYYDVFSSERHIKPCQPQPWHTRWLGIDWGFAHNSVALWCSQTAHNLTAYYREFVGQGRSPKALAQEIVDRTPVEERKLIKQIFLSHDAFAKRDERDTIAQQMGQVFHANDMPAPVQASKDVVGRATLLYTMMQEPDGQGVVIDPSCQKLIETIPMVCRDEDEPERPLKFEGDDAIDAAWYGLTFRLTQQPRPHEMEIQEHADSIADPVARWFYLKKQRSLQAQSPVIQPRVVLPWQMEQP